MAIILSIILTLGIFYLVLPALLKISLRRRFLSGIRRSGRICLTFDDGPDPRSTPQILELLRRHNTKATFFLLGQNVEKYPHLVQEILRNGHEIGEHSYSHTFAWLTDPYRSFQDAILGSRVLRQFQMPIALFRPPYGKINAATLIYAMIFHRKFAWWNVDPRDYAASSAQDIAQTVTSQAMPGSVILLHDGRREKGSPPQLTVQALELILDHLAAKQIPLSTLSQSLKQHPASGLLAKTETSR